MSFIDDYDLSDYESIDELREVRSSIRSEISVLEGYVRGIDDKMRAIQRAVDDDASE